ncbi:MAG: AtpZ/AtpI family protein [Alphaproteobacteria bacterium]|nr:AtpZ/AtpI family protein [Alphaproteobacteria bacterium]
MNKTEPPPHPDAPPSTLKQRIQALEQATQNRPTRLTPDQSKARRQGILLQNLGFRVASDLLAGVIVGIVIGLAFDYFFHTSPWGFIAFFILGSSSGVLNVYRLLQPRQPKV